MFRFVIRVVPGTIKKPYRQRVAVIFANDHRSVHRTNTNRLRDTENNTCVR